MPDSEHIVDMIRTVLKPGERVHYLEVTKRVISAFPNWAYGKTPENTIRRDLSQFSTRHPENGEIYFHAEDAEGVYSAYDLAGILSSASPRERALVEFAKHTGQEVPASFLQNTRVACPEAGVDQFHNLLSGIFKPRGHKYALCIKKGIASPYDTVDRLERLSDGRWVLAYAERVGGQGHAENRALQSCVEDHVPVGVVYQASSVRGQSRYEIMGLGMVRSYEAGAFRIDSATELEIKAFAAPADPITREGLAISSLLLRPFSSTTTREHRESNRMVPVRDAAFRHKLRELYTCKCAVCRTKFVLQRPPKAPIIEVEGAHIRPVDREGSDDPRNGVALCKRHHWSLDKGLFTITEDYKIRVSKAVSGAQRERFDLEEYDKTEILLPLASRAKPHAEVLDWHQRKVFIS